MSLTKAVLNQEEARWLNDKWSDFYYYFDVESMYQRDQEIFQKIGQKLSEVKQSKQVLENLLKKILEK